MLGMNTSVNKVLQASSMIHMKVAKYHDLHILDVIPCFFDCCRQTMLFSDPVSRCTFDCMFVPA